MKLDSETLDLLKKTIEMGVRNGTIFTSHMDSEAYDESTGLRLLVTSETTPELDEFYQSLREVMRSRGDVNRFCSERILNASLNCSEPV